MSRAALAIWRLPPSPLAGCSRRARSRRRRTRRHSDRTQNDAIVARADTLLIAGRIFAAESLYYVAVRRGPRDPAARLALGRYLAQRGALKVGAVLMEEARYFGGDPDCGSRSSSRRCTSGWASTIISRRFRRTRCRTESGCARSICATTRPAIAGPDSATSTTP